MEKEAKSSELVTASIAWLESKGDKKGKVKEKIEEIPGCRKVGFGDDGVHGQACDRTKAKYESSLWRLLPCVNLLFRSGHKFLMFFGLQLKFEGQIRFYFANPAFLGFIIYVPNTLFLFRENPFASQKPLQNFWKKFYQKRFAKIRFAENLC